MWWTGREGVTFTRTVWQHLEPFSFVMTGGRILLASRRSRLLTILPWAASFITKNYPAQSIDNAVVEKLYRDCLYLFFVTITEYLRLWNLLRKEVYFGAWVWKIRNMILASAWLLLRVTCCSIITESGMTERKRGQVVYSNPLWNYFHPCMRVCLSIW